MRSFKMALFAAFVASAGFVACSSSDDKGDGGGTGGAAGSTGGASGKGGAGGASGCTPPQCLVDLAKDCVPSGTCMSAMGGTTFNMCWSNGVKSATVAGLMSSTTWSKDGKTCYVVDTVFDLAAMMTTLTYKDAAGATKATVKYNNMNPNKWSVTCGGSTTEFDSSACGQGGAGGSTGCTMGTCN